jgi:hypothetical protein
MTINDLINFCITRLEFLKALKISYIQLGDYDMVNKIESQILETENTLNHLRNS